MYESGSFYTGYDSIFCSATREAFMSGFSAFKLNINSPFNNSKFLGKNLRKHRRSRSTGKRKFGIEIMQQMIIYLIFDNYLYNSLLDDIQTVEMSQTSKGTKNSVELNNEIGLRKYILSQKSINDLDVRYLNLFNPGETSNSLGFTSSSSSPFIALSALNSLPKSPDAIPILSFDAPSTSVDLYIEKEIKPIKISQNKTLFSDLFKWKKTTTESSNAVKSPPLLPKRVSISNDDITDLMSVKHSRKEHNLYDMSHEIQDSLYIFNISYYRKYRRSLSSIYANNAYDQYHRYKNRQRTDSLSRILQSKLQTSSNPLSPATMNDNVAMNPNKVNSLHTPVKSTGRTRTISTVSIKSVSKPRDMTKSPPKSKYPNATTSIKSVEKTPDNLSLSKNTVDSSISKYALLFFDLGFKSAYQGTMIGFNRNSSNLNDLRSNRPTSASIDTIEYEIIENCSDLGYISEDERLYEYISFDEFSPSTKVNESKVTTLNTTDDAKESYVGKKLSNNFNKSMENVKADWFDSPVNSPNKMAYKKTGISNIKFGFKFNKISTSSGYLFMKHKRRRKSQYISNYLPELKVHAYYKKYSKSHNKVLFNSYVGSNVGSYSVKEDRNLYISLPSIDSDTSLFTDDANSSNLKAVESNQSNSEIFDSLMTSVDNISQKTTACNQIDMQSLGSESLQIMTSIDVVDSHVKVLSKHANPDSITNNEPTTKETVQKVRRVTRLKSNKLTYTMGENTDLSKLF